MTFKVLYDDRHLSMRRHLALASDRDRIAAARYAAEKLAIRLAIIARRRRLLWEHYSDSNGAVVSVNA